MEFQSIGTRTEGTKSSVVTVILSQLFVMLLLTWTELTNNDNISMTCAEVVHIKPYTK